MVDFYMTPGGAGLVDGSSPANAFDWAGFDAWQAGGVGNANPGDTLYVGPGTYTVTSTLNAATDGTAGNYIEVVGVSSLTTMAEADGDDRPLFNTGAFLLWFDDYWNVRNLRVVAAAASVALRMWRHGKLSNCDVLNTGAGDAIQLGSSNAEAYNCRASSPLGRALYMSSFSAVFLDCVAYDSAVGIKSISSRNGVIGNLVYGCTVGLELTVTTVGRFIGNTFYDCATAATSNGTGLGNVFLRNIISDCAASVVWLADPGDETWDFNNWWNSGAPVNVIQGSRATFIDPQFVNPALGTAAGFVVRNAGLRGIGLTEQTIGAIVGELAAAGQPGYDAGFAAGQAIIAPGVDFSSDQYFLHDLETVELDGVDVLNVYRHPEMEVEQAPTQGVYVSRHVQFDFPVGESLYPADRRPFVGSAVVDGDANTYVIESVQHPFQSDYYGCQCRSSVIAGTFNLDDTVSLFAATYTQDRALGKKTTQTADASFADVACAIMLVDSTSEQYAGQNQFVEQYEIYVEEDIGQVNNGDILKDSSLKEYQIVSYRNRLHFNEFSVMLCELRTVGP